MAEELESAATIHAGRIVEIARNSLQRRQQENDRKRHRVPHVRRHQREERRPKFLRLEDLQVIRKTDEIEDSRPLETVLVQTDPGGVNDRICGQQQNGEQGRSVEQIREKGALVTDRAGAPMKSSAQ